MWLLVVLFVSCACVCGLFLFDTRPQIQTQTCPYRMRCKRYSRTVTRVNYTLSLAHTHIPHLNLVFSSGASQAGIGRPGTLCVGAARCSAAVCCVRGGGGGGQEINYTHTHSRVLCACDLLIVLHTDTDTQTHTHTHNVHVTIGLGAGGTRGRI